MGIPRFYRYMSERYPLINQPISDVSLLPEFDAFYLDMNGIIHNCTHSDGGDSDALSTLGLAAQLHNIFTYMDRLITHIIKPKQLVYIAIDGVAPRAKLNQQRSRRFRAGLDRQEALEKEKYLQIKLEDEKNGNRGAVEAKDKFDSNCITPGTEFLEHLSHHLVYFVRQKMKTDPLWARLEVFFSGSEVPGEGEHKIVEFIRHRKMMPGYGANVRHCMYGSDADLMLLGPMTHEPHFTLVREVVVWGSHKVKVQAKQIEEQQWQLVHLSLFREYLMMEMRVMAPLDGERMLDDFILLTFLLGNDFIPHSPTLEISEDAIPLLLQVYRELLEKHQGQYLTENGKLVNIELLQELFHVIGSQEEDILTNRAIEESKKKHRGGPRGGRNERPIVTHDVNEDLVQNAILVLNDSDDEDRPPPLLDDEDEEEDEDEKEKALLEALDGELETKLALEVEEEEHQLFAELSGSQSFQDTKWGYYERKFKLTRGDGNAHNKGLEEIKKHYMEALMWCIAYYFQGPPSWSWFYPYHYAPMVSDLTNISEIVAKIKFNDDPETDGPLLPFEQLMSNLPASSAHLVPEPYRFLMVSPLSPIKHFYPETFDIDMEGKKNSWEGVNILPFIDVTLLKQAIAQYCPDSRLTQSERRRNTLKMRPLRIVLDLSVVDTLPSSLPGVPGFPDIPVCNTRVEDFTLPPITVHGGQFQSRLMDGVTLPLAGFPSLYTVPLEAVRIDHVRLNCFGMASRKATFILQVGPTSVTESGAPAVPPQDLISKTVLVNWPNLHEALVVGVSSLAGEYRRKKNAKGKKEVVFTPYENDEKTSWAYYAQSEVVKLLSGRGSPGSGGIDLGKSGISTVLHVLPLQGMVSNPLTGAIEKKFGDVEALVPYQLAVVNRKLHDDRFQETGKLALAERFPPKSVALITNGEWLGCTAEVVECDEDENEVKVRVNTIDKEPPFGYVVAEKITDKYFPGYLVAQKLGISTTTLGVLTGNVNVNPGGFDIGLNIRFRKDLLLPGYCRLVNRTSPQQGGHKDASEEANVWRKGDIVKIVGSGEYDAALKKDSQQSQRNGGGGAVNGSNTVWEYSERAVKLLAAYKAEFPAIVSKLDKLPFGTSYNGKELFGVRDGKEIEIKAELVKVWIEQQHLGGKEHSKHIPVTSEYLSLSAIRAVEAAGALRATERQKHAAQNQVKPVKALIPAHHLFRPNPLVNQDLTGSEVSRRATKNPGAPKLGDRIINISGRGIPFGHRGTVVATHVSSKCVEVLFDEKFTGGEPLYGTVSLDRGKIVSWNNVICVSTPPGSQGARSASSVDASHRQYASKNGLPRANDGSVKILSKAKNDSSRKGGKKETSNNGNALRVSSNSGVPAVPPLPPIPSSLPPPPDASKMQMLLEKWTGGEAAPADGSAAKGSPKPKSQQKSTKKDSSAKKTTTAKPAVTESVPAAPATAANPEIAPSVMAFFSAAQVSGVELQPAALQPPAPGAAMLDLFPHNYAGTPGAHSLMTPPPPLPQGAYGHPVFVPHLLVPQAISPPPPHRHHAFINPYQPPPPPPPPGAHAYMVNTGAQQYAAPPVLPTEPKLSEDEYPTLATAATKASKKTQVAVTTAKTTVVPTTEAGVTVVVSEEQKKKTSRNKQQTPKSKKLMTAAATGKEKVWVPKTAVETEPKAAKPSGGPQLLLPAQVLRHQQQKQQ